MNRLSGALLILISMMAIVASAAPVSSTAPAALPISSPVSFQTIIAFETWAKLDLVDQESYLRGLQMLMTDLAAQDEAVHMQYQSAPKIAGARDTAFLQWLLPTAVAEDADDGASKRCVYAGFVSELDVNGRYCLAPSSAGCGQGQVQCNPLLYGAGKCTKTGKLATSFCTRSAKSPAEIAREIRAKGAAGQAEWTKFKTELSGYCESPRPSQLRVCAMIQTRMIGLLRAIGKDPETLASTEGGAALSATPTPTPVIVRARPNETAKRSETPAEQTRSSIPRTTSRATAPSSPKVPATVPPPGSVNGVCNPISLLGNLKHVGEDARGWNFMGLEAARAMMCSTEAIPSEWYQKIRARALTRLATASSADKWQRENKTSIQLLLKNFDRCYQEAVKMRAAGQTPTTGADATVTYLGRDLVNIQVRGKLVASSCGIGDLEGLLLSQNVNICNIRIIDPVDAGISASRNGFGAGPASRSAR